MAIAKTLPFEAAMILRRASQTPITAKDPLARQKAIEIACAQVMRMYPAFFKSEPLETPSTGK